MNNNYDREDAPKTYDQMRESGYEMTADGFWVPSEGEPMTLDPEELVAATKLLLLITGEQVLAQVDERMDTDTITLVDPREVRLEATTSDGDTSTSSVSYSTWLPLSQARRITIKSSYVVCVTDPIKSLVDSYMQEFALDD